MQILEQRIGEDLDQIGLASGFRVIGEGAQIEIIGRRQLEQHLRRYRSLVAFEMVEIGGRDPEIGRHLGLSQAEIIAQSLQPPAEEEFAIQISHVHLLTQNLS